MSEQKKKDTRTRNWTIVVYPESAPENWRDILDEMHVPWVESPLHDKDVEPDGTVKKAHWHILLMFANKKSYAQIKEISQALNAPNPQKCENAKGMVRYFAHMDSPHKYQYDKSEIVAHGGAEIASYLQATKMERYQLISEMIRFVRENDITEMKDLIDYALESRFEDWFPLLCDNSAFIMEQYIKSNRHGGKR
ncbi:MULTISPECIES: replication protein [Enterococcus]|uniref:replication protein n=1 Tax=Enterococcus TaxID=1350 RepID=UPI00100DD58C|nr:MULTISPECIES: replication protein [Enterococcus]EMF0445334.1 replication protein [Enterococcus faecium]RXW67931.1 replication protein [Enterococcus faecium]TKN32483.1 replication protein [Enterococcus faecium]TKN81363.1 replication protein [Enterococcus faecium]TKN81504.1 replication protein [Enterococcus faecium]